MGHIAAGIGSSTRNLQRNSCGISRAPLQAAAFLLVAAGCALGQDAISLSSGSAAAGASVPLNLSLSVASGSQPAGLQWTYKYSTTDFSAVSVTAGPAAVAAGKTLSCTGAPGATTCVLYGVNGNTLSNGVVAVASFQISQTTTDSSAPVQVINSSGAAINDNAVGVTASGGVVTITSNPPTNDTVTGLSCAPATITTPGAAGCTITLSAPAPTGGATVTTGVGSGTPVTIPSSVVVAAGATTAGFTASAQAVSSNGTAVLSASLNGSSQSFQLTLQPPPTTPPSSVLALASFSCAPALLPTPGPATCTVGVSAPAPASGAVVALSGGTANLSIPAMVEVAGGATSATFSVSASTVNMNTTVQLAASLNGSSLAFTLTLEPALANVSLTAFSCSPANLSSHASSTCTVSLSAAAPIGGVSVAIQRSSANGLSIPASVTVPAGAKSAAFAVQTGNINSNQTVTLTASLNGKTMSTVLTLSPGVKHLHY